MYNNGYATSPPLTVNNPFVHDPTNPSTRFPDISTSASPWASNMSSTPTGYGMQMGYQQAPQQQQQQQPLSLNTNFGQPTYFGSSQMSPTQGTMTPFQPTSSFGQQLAAQTSGSSYGYLYGQNSAQQQPSSYNPAQQQLQNNPNYIAQFDPYAPLAQGWDGSQSQSQMQNQAQSYQNQNLTQTLPSGSGGYSASGNPHPREYIRTHKAEIESWDNYAWKQLLGAFDSLKNAWDTRKQELSGKMGQLQMQMQYGGFYQGQIQQEGMRLQGLLTEAGHNFDSVAASIFQIQEVFNGYRQSGDLASKRRVREATNAALNSLPDWPPQAY